MVKIPKEVTFDPTENIIIGNTCLYGATSGEAYINGVAGERFAVRNSGVHSVVEGVGDHGCEYMTGGRVVVIGKTGRNFAAGMSGGVAYVWDPEKTFDRYINHRLVDIEYLVHDEDIEEVYSSIKNHHKLYWFKKGQGLILENWEKEKDNFWKIISGEYKKAAAKLAKRKGGIEMN